MHMMVFIFTNQKSFGTHEKMREKKIPCSVKNYLFCSNKSKTTMYYNTNIKTVNHCCRSQKHFSW